MTTLDKSQPILGIVPIAGTVPGFPSNSNQLDGLFRKVIPNKNPDGSVFSQQKLENAYYQTGKGDKKSPSFNNLDLKLSQSQPLSVKLIWFIGLYTGSILVFALLISSVRWILRLVTGYSY